MKKVRFRWSVGRSAADDRASLGGRGGGKYTTQNTTRPGPYDPTRPFLFSHPSADQTPLLHEGWTGICICQDIHYNVHKTQFYSPRPNKNYFLASNSLHLSNPSTSCLCRTPTPSIKPQRNAHTRRRPKSLPKKLFLLLFPRPSRLNP